MNHRPTTVLALIYALPAFPLALGMLPMVIFLPTFYSSDLGLDLATVGWVFLASRIWDIVIDPLVGYLSDHCLTRFGRRKPWLILSALPTLYSAWMLYVPAPGVGPGYLLTWTLAFYLFWTLISLPYLSWGAELSQDYHQRTRIVGAREFANIGGTLFAAALPALIQQSMDEVLKALVYVMWITLPISLSLAVRHVPEPELHLRHTPSFDWRQGRQILVRNANFRQLAAAFLLNGIGNALPASLVMLYIPHVLKMDQHKGIFLGCLFAASIAAIPLWLHLSQRHLKHSIWKVSIFVACCSFAIVPTLNPGDYWLYLFVCVTSGVTFSADAILPYSMLADVVDADTALGGGRRTGFFFALWGIATKLALALPMGLAFPLISLSGFVPSEPENTPFALLTLTLFYSVVPIFFKIASIYFIKNYTLDVNKHHRIQADIARLIINNDQ